MEILNLASGACPKQQPQTEQKERQAPPADPNRVAAAAASGNPLSGMELARPSHRGAAETAKEPVVALRLGQAVTDSGATVAALWGQKGMQEPAPPPRTAHTSLPSNRSCASAARPSRGREAPEAREARESQWRAAKEKPFAFEALFQRPARRPRRSRSSHARCTNDPIPSRVTGGASGQPFSTQKWPTLFALRLPVPGSALLLTQVILGV